MPGERKLAAIVSADVAGYSRLMGQDEAATLAGLNALTSQHIFPLTQAHDGRIVKEMGDGFLIEFPSIVSAVKCSCEIQRQLADGDIDAAQSIRFRIGVHLGDVIVQGADIFGDGVNIASRLQEIADPGGVAISHSAYEHLDDASAAGFMDRGERQLKNLRRAIRVWHWAASPGAHDTPDAENVGSVGADTRPAIAVLPLSNLHNNADDEYFADGLTEDLISAISRWRRIPVIARSSVFTYKGRSVRLDEVARELGVRYVLDGSIRKSANRVRISLTLADAEIGQQLWAERFDRQLEDIFELQDEITQKVAARLGYQIEQAEIIRTRHRGAKDSTAWDLVAQGLPHFYAQNCEGNMRALEVFARATQLNPSYGDAWAYLGWTHAHNLMDNCPVDRDETTRLGFEACRRAVSLDDQSALAHLALSSVHVWSGNIEQALKSGRRSLELNPFDVRAGLAVGNRMTLLGQVEEGIQQIKAALRLNPLDPYNWIYFGYLSRSYLDLGDCSAALAWAERAAELRPDQPDPHFRLALCHAHSGDFERASLAMSQCDRIRPGFVEQRRHWQPYPSVERSNRLLKPLRDNGLL